jgi:DNA-binding transcriptional MerR regulator
MSFGSSAVPPVREGFVMTSSNNQITDGMTSSVPGYSGNRAAAVVGITYRQLDYWARTDLVRPSITEARGSGSRRLYSYRNLLELRMVKNLLDAGIKLESVRDAFKYLQDRPDADITSAHLVINGSSVVLCQGDELIDVVRRGQGVLNLLPLAQVKDQVDGQLISLEAISQKDVEASTLADRRVGRTG